MNPENKHPHPGPIADPDARAPGCWEHVMTATPAQKGEILRQIPVRADVSL